MKRCYFLFSIFYFLFLTSATPTLNFQHDQIQPGETILATITTSGTFTKQIEPADITFLENRKQVFFEHDITFYNGTHYLYIYTTRTGNFTVKIENILYKELNDLKSKTIQQNFTIQDESNQTQILSIKPGFIFTTQIPKIKLTNMGTATLNATFSKNEISIQPLKTKEITFVPTEIFSIAEISSYKNFLIPIIYPPANGTFQTKPQLDLKPNPQLLFAELFVKNKSQEIIQLFNFGNESIANITITSDQTFIDAKPIQNISAREVYNLTLTLSPLTSGYFNGNINITYTQYEKQNILQIPLSIFVLPQGSTKEDFKISEETCEQKQGTPCTTDEICDGKATFTKDNEYCCMGTCQPINQDENGFSYGWLIAIIIFITLAGAGYYFYKKQKKIKPQTPDEKIKETSEKYSKRIQGGLSNS
ncbi:MAG: hypothetical protein V1889_01190 [archaeon]